MSLAGRVSSPLSLESCVVATTDHLSSDLSGEVVILSLTDGVYYGLDAVGALIWRSLGEPRIVRDVVADVTRQYGVDPAQCEHDVLVFLEDLRAHQLAKVVDGDPG